MLAWFSFPFGGSAIRFEVTNGAAKAVDAAPLKKVRREERDALGDSDGFMIE